MRTLRMVGCLLFCVGACGGDVGPTGPVKVGLLAPKSGALEQVGLSFERVANVAVGSINEKGGVDGRQFELLVEDTQTVADTAGVKLQGLIDQGVIAVIGPATSGEVTNAYPVARDRMVPIISPSSTAPALSKPVSMGGPDDHGYMFRNVPDDEIQGIAMAYYLVNLRMPTVASVAVLFENTPYGIGLKNAFAKSFRELGGTVSLEVDFPQNLPEDIAVARAEIQDLVNANPQPQMVVLVALEQDAVKLVTAWDNSGAPQIPNMQWFMTDGARSSGFLDAVPASLRGMCGTAPTFPIQGLAYARLTDAYEAVYTDKIGDQVFAPNVWDGFHILAAAMVHQARRYPNEDLGGEHLRDAITLISREGQTFHSGQWRDLTLALRSGNDIDYDGAAGPNDFDVVGQAVGPYEVWCIANNGESFTQELFLNATEIQMLAP